MEAAGRGLDVRPGPGDEGTGPRSGVVGGESAAALACVQTRSRGWVPDDSLRATASGVGRGRHRDGRPTLVAAPSALRAAIGVPNRWSVLGVLTVLLVAAVVFGGRTWWVNAVAAPTPVASGTPVGLITRTMASLPGQASSASPGIPSAASGAASSGTGVVAAPSVVVHVVGAIRRPGVVALRSGDRVRDAVTRCGGAGPGADLTGINLARPVVDGEQIRVPRRGETLPPPSDGVPSGSGSGPMPAPGRGPGGIGGGTAGGTSSGAAGPLDLNTATLESLDALPGIGPVIAQRIVDWRTEHGRFSTVDELAEVAGIGEKLLARIAPLVRV